MQTRRQFLATSTAAAAALVTPAASMTIGLDVAAAPSKSSVVMWAVGSDGEFDWQAVAAETLEEAIRVRACNEGMICPETGELEKIYEGQRCEAWDAIKGDPAPGDWLRAGLGYCCTRCGYECHPDTGARPLGDDAICEECLTLEDWDQIDPEYAAELREEVNAE